MALHWVGRTFGFVAAVERCCERRERAVMPGAGWMGRGWWGTDGLGELERRGGMAGRGLLVIGFGWEGWTSSLGAFAHLG